MRLNGGVELRSGLAAGMKRLQEVSLVRGHAGGAVGRCARAADPPPGYGSATMDQLLANASAATRSSDEDLKLAAALPGALVPELLWAHYMPALSVDCEQNKGPAFRARYPSGQVKLRSSLPEPFRAAPRSLGPSVHGMDRRYQGELLIRSSWHGRLRYLPQHHGYIRSR